MFVIVLLVPESYPSEPPMPETDAAPLPVEESPVDTQQPSIRPARTVSSDGHSPPPLSTPVGTDDTTVHEELPAARPSRTIPQPPPNADTIDPTTGYGPGRPVRRRILYKDGASALYRPGRTAQDDFLDTMQELVPHLIQHAMETTPNASSASEPVEPSSTVESRRGQKRMVEDTSGPEQPAGKRSAAHDHAHDMDDSLLVEQAGNTFAKDEVAICSVEVLQQQQYDPKGDNLHRVINQLISMYREGHHMKFLLEHTSKRRPPKSFQCQAIRLKSKLRSTRPSFWSGTPS